MGAFDFLPGLGGDDGADGGESADTDEPAARDGSADAAESGRAAEADSADAVESADPAALTPADYRERAAELADRSDVPTLDFTLASLGRLDEMAAGNAPVADRVAYGSYLGETLVRVFDGEWGEADDSRVVTVALPDGETTVAVFDAAAMALESGPVFEKVAQKLRASGATPLAAGERADRGRADDERPDAEQADDERPDDAAERSADGADGATDDAAPPDAAVADGSATVTSGSRDEEAVEVPGIATEGDETDDTAEMPGNRAGGSVDAEGADEPPEPNEAESDDEPPASAAADSSEATARPVGDDSEPDEAGADPSGDDGPAGDEPVSVVEPVASSADDDGTDGDADDDAGPAGTTGDDASDDDTSRPLTRGGQTTPAGSSGGEDRTPDESGAVAEGDTVDPVVEADEPAAAADETLLEAEDTPVDGSDRLEDGSDSSDDDTDQSDAAADATDETNETDATDETDETDATDETDETDAADETGASAESDDAAGGPLESIDDGTEPTDSDTVGPPDAAEPGPPDADVLREAAAAFAADWPDEDLDGTPASLPSLDRFVDEQWGGRFEPATLSERPVEPGPDAGPLTRVGAYYGQVLVRWLDGEWVRADSGEPAVRVSGEAVAGEAVAVVAVFDDARECLGRHATFAYRYDALLERLDRAETPVSDGRPSLAVTGGSDDDPSSAEVITAVADDAAVFADEWPAYDLDYSPRSLARLDDLVEREFGGYALDLVPLAEPTDAASLFLTGRTAEAGAYFATVAVRHLDAQWRIDDEVALVVDGPAGTTTVRPFETAGARLRGGDAFAARYETLRDRYAPAAPSVRGAPE